jgi:hypothetical protein
MATSLAVHCVEHLQQQQLQQQQQSTEAGSRSAQHSNGPWPTGSSLEQQPFKALLDAEGGQRSQLSHRHMLMDAAMPDANTGLLAQSAAFRRGEVERPVKWLKVLPESSNFLGSEQRLGFKAYP